MCTGINGHQLPRDVKGPRGCWPPETTPAFGARRPSTQTPWPRRAVCHPNYGPQCCPGWSLSYSSSTPCRSCEENQVRGNGGMRRQLSRGEASNSARRPPSLQVVTRSSRGGVHPVATAFAAHSRPVSATPAGSWRRGATVVPLLRPSLAPAFSRHPRELEGSLSFLWPRKHLTAVIFLLWCSLNNPELPKLDTLDPVPR